jgi:hypothetical protein
MLRSFYFRTVHKNSDSYAVIDGNLSNISVFVT